MRGDQRQGWPADDARGRRRAALPGDLSSGLTVRLLGDHEVVARPVDAGDKAALARGFGRLSEQSRYQRFLTGIQELGDSDLRYLTDVDHHRHEALVALESGTGDIVGVARFVRNADTTSAEAAVTVVDEWQGRGLGTALASLLADRAREEGIERFTALLLSGNTQIQDVLASIGPAEVVSRESGTIQVEVAIPPRGIGAQMAGVLRVVAGGAVELATPPWGLRPASGAS